MGLLLDSVYNFIERHFFAIAASCAGGSYLFYRHSEKKAERAQAQRERTRANDLQKERFAKNDADLTKIRVPFPSNIEAMHRDLWNAVNR